MSSKSIPYEYTSHPAPYSSPRIISGAAKSGVPTMVAAIPLAEVRDRDDPKSAILARKKVGD
jgi:hypothetical protein